MLIVFVREIYHFSYMMPCKISIYLRNFLSTNFNIMLQKLNFIYMDRRSPCRC
ncbi:MAG: hypothetical protein METHAR1v1_1790012 [Methanothrix sp.]|nr:MAG: hypothetical protein METHAR1v1_1790012 [Methanothrix sp.]